MRFGWACAHSCIEYEGGWTESSGQPELLHAFIHHLFTCLSNCENCRFLFFFCTQFYIRNFDLKLDEKCFFFFFLCSLRFHARKRDIPTCQDIFYFFCCNIGRLVCSDCRTQIMDAFRHIFWIMLSRAPVFLYVVSAGYQKLAVNVVLHSFWANRRKTEAKVFVLHPSVHPSVHYLYHS